MDYLILLLGFAALIIGGELLVKGSVGLAFRLGMSALTIGMTIVSFGTSVPELLVSIKAVFQEGVSTNGERHNLMSVGNVVGSNIANLSLVLGVTAIIAPVAVARVSLVRYWPILMGASLLATYFMMDLVVTRGEGIVLFSMLILFTGYMITSSMRNKEDDMVDPEVDPANQKSTGMNIIFIVLGITGLAFGSGWLVTSATNIATSFGVSPFVIGVTVLAFGTSVPELVTSGIAAYRGQTDLALGNLMGSNIFNIFSVLGITAILSPVPLTQSIFDTDIKWMLLIVVFLVILMLIKRKLNRWKGLLLVLFYLLYVTMLFLR
ncbi:MAG: cation:H+ antiporter [Saprospiraceae bacterium]|jgi:cation:H+ antiporter